MNILSAVITFVLMIAIGFGLFFFLMLALNGFSERDANPAMIFYIGWALVFALISAAGSYFLTKFLIAKSLNAILAVAISVIAAGGIGLLADVGGMLVGTVIASEVRNSYMKK